MKKKTTVSAHDVQEIFKRLSKEYPNPKTELVYADPFQLLVSVILSAQCTDAQVNRATPGLFAQFPSPQTLAKAPLPTVEKLIHSCGFYRMKAKAITATAQDIVSKFGGKIPGTLEDLITLRGVGRKTASVVLNQAFDIPAIAVDTHVMRVSQRLGWAKHTTAEKIEWELRELLPMPLWSSVNGLLILHGRRICKARKPLCEECSIRNFCAYYRKTK